MSRREALACKTVLSVHQHKITRQCCRIHRRHCQLVHPSIKRKSTFNLKRLWSIVRVHWSTLRKQVAASSWRNLIRCRLLMPRSMSSKCRKPFNTMLRRKYKWTGIRIWASSMKIKALRLWLIRRVVILIKNNQDRWWCDLDSRIRRESQWCNHRIPTTSFSIYRKCKASTMIWRARTNFQEARKTLLIPSDQIKRNRSRLLNFFQRK